jgi:hypothetical protein
MIHFEQLHQPSERIGKTRLKNAGEVDKERGWQPSGVRACDRNAVCKGRRRATAAGGGGGKRQLKYRYIFCGWNNQKRNEVLKIM